VGATLTLTASTNLGGTAIEIRSQEGAVGTANDIIASDSSMNLSYTTVYGGISTINVDTGADGGAVDLTVNASTSFAALTINGGSGADETISSANGLNLTDVTLANIATVNIDTANVGTDTLIIDTGTNLSTAAITGSGDDQIVFNETGTYSFANNAVTGVATLTFNGTGANSLTVNQADITGGVTTITGNTGTDTITTAETSLNLSSVTTLTSIDNITTTNTTGTAFTGTAGNDIFTGISGVDTFIGGAGADVLTGGTGVDTFTYTTVTDSMIGSLDTILDFVAGGSGDKIDTNIIGTKAVIGNQSTGDTLANLSLATLNTLANSTNGTLSAGGTILSGGSANTEVMQLTTSDSNIIWAIDVDGSGVFDASDTIIDVTGLTGTINTADFV
ncbi:MAG: calcium-binding protein, partial [Rhodospirillales bacterium]|nr:calcium-binding protein [Rhodospirillales bacterium]